MFARLIAVPLYLVFLLAMPATADAVLLQYEFTAILSAQTTDSENYDGANVFGVYLFDMNDTICCPGGGFIRTETPSVAASIKLSSRPNGAPDQTIFYTVTATAENRFPTSFDTFFIPSVTIGNPPPNSDFFTPAWEVRLGAGFYRNSPTPNFPMLPEFDPVGVTLVADGFVVDPFDPDREFFAVENISVTVQVIPEPTTLAILGLGLAGLGMMRRRRAA